MRAVVLKTYAQLLSSLHHRLLPEGAIRAPLQRLIHFCHQLDVDGVAGEGGIHAVCLISMRILGC